MGRACSKLGGNPAACATFLSSATKLLDSLRSEQLSAGQGPDASVGCQQLIKDLRAFIGDLRPRESDADVPEAAAQTIWQLWWEQQRSHQVAWQAIAQDVSESAPSAGLQHLAQILASLAQKSSADGD